MTVSSTSNRVVYNGNGVTTVFPFAFKVNAPADLVVIYTDANGNIYTLTASQYTATGFGVDAGGTVAYPIGGVAPIAVGATLTIYRDVAVTQPAAISNQGAMWPTVIEAALDRATMIIQRVVDSVSRSLVISPTDSGAINALPAAAARANSVLGFDGSGQPYAAVLTGSLVGVSSWLVTNFLGAASRAAARVSLGQFGPLGDARGLYGAVGDGFADDTAALAGADAASGGTLQPGTYFIGGNLTLASDWVFNPGAKLSIAAGKTVTFNGDVKGPRNQQLFTGSGTAVLAGQRSEVYCEWWCPPGVGLGILDATPGMQAMSAAMVNGGNWRPLRARYSMSGGVVFTTPVRIIGAARGYNPGVGGTVFAPINTFCLTGGALFTMTGGSSSWADFMVLGASTTNTAYAYTAIKTALGAGKLDLRNIEIIGVGVGLDLPTGQNGVVSNVRVQNWAIAMRFGGVAGQFCVSWRFNGCTFTNPNSTSVTNASTASGNAILHFASTAGMSVGMGIAGINIPLHNVIDAINTGTGAVTMHLASTGTVASGATIRWGSFIEGEGLQFLGNCSDLYFTDCEGAGGYTMVHPLGAAGQSIPQAITFKGCNFTSSTFFGLLLERCYAFFSTDTWWGDVPFGSTVRIDAAGGTASLVEGATFIGGEIGGAGFHGLQNNCGTNLTVLGVALSGNSLATSSTYAGIYCGPAARGDLIVTGGTKATNKLANSVQGQAGYGVYLDAASYAGTGDTVMVFGTTLNGLTAAISDSSSPTSTKKVIGSNAF